MAVCVRRRGEKGFRRISWDEATTLVAERLRGTDPHRMAWYVTSRGLTNEAYYAHQKVARFLGTNHLREREPRPWEPKHASAS